MLFFFTIKKVMESQNRKLQMEISTLTTENKLMKEKYNRATGIGVQRWTITSIYAFTLIIKPVKFVIMLTKTVSLDFIIVEIYRVT